MTITPLARSIILHANTPTPLLITLLRADYFE